MKSNKKRSLKIISALLVILMLAGTAGAIVYAQNSDNSEDKESDVQTVSKTEEDTASSKSETVYVLANADGSVKKVIVSDWLKNTLEKKSITDFTDLEDVTNVKGDESYSMNSDNMRVWDADGKDIYYQGTTDKKLPVDISVSYKLDGTEISAEELAGKSGKVTMRFEYKNNESKTVEIDGEDETIYVPFVMLTGMILDNDNFTNVEVSNGKLINDGSRSFVLGFALPGMQENLDISEDTLDIPDSVEITADVKDFSLTTTMTFATNDMFNNLELDDIEDIDDLQDAMEKLNDASNQLIDGSSDLYDGLATLLAKSNQLIAGIDKLASGAKALKDGASDLDKGANELKAGLDTLSDGLNKLVGNNDKLNGGAKKVYESLLSAAGSQLKAAGLTVPALTIENYNKVLNEVLASLNDDTVKKVANAKALETVTKEVNKQESVIREQVEVAVKAKVLEGVLAAVGKPMTAEEYANAVKAGLIPQELQAKVNAAVTAQMKTSEAKGKIDAATKAQIEKIISQQMQSKEVKQQINAAISKAAQGRSSISALIKQLNEYNEFYKGIRDYTDGVSAAYAGSGALNDGADKLTGGTKKLKDGSKELSNGLDLMKNSSGALIDGVTKLKDGSMQLSDGIKEFNESGIKKLLDIFDGNVKGLINRMQAVVDVSKEYNSFAGISDDSDGSVKFVYRTDSIGD